MEYLKGESSNSFSQKLQKSCASLSMLIFYDVKKYFTELVCWLTLNKKYFIMFLKGESSSPIFIFKNLLNLTNLQ